MKAKVVKLKVKVGNAPAGHHITVQYDDRSRSYPNVDDIKKALLAAGLISGSPALSTTQYEILK